MQAGRSRELATLAVFAVASAVVLVAYVLIVRRLPLDVFWHPDEGAKFVVMQTVRWSGPQDYSLPYAGRAIDPSFHYYPPRDSIYPAPAANGTISFRWPIYFPLLSRLGYESYGLPGIYLIPIGAGWLVATLTGLWVWLFRPRAAPLAVLLAGLATPLAFYSVSFFEHTLATLLGVAALTCLICWPGRVLALIAATPMLAASVALRAELIGFAAAAAIAWGLAWAMRRRWEAPGLLRPTYPPWVRIAGLLSVLVVLAVVITKVVPARHLEVLTHIPHLIDRMWFKSEFFFDNVLRVFVGEPGLTNYRLLQFWQIAALMALGGLIAGPFADTREIEMALVLPSLFVLLQTSLLTALYTLPFLQRQGVLAVAPFIGIAVYGLPEAWRRRDLRFLTLAAAGGGYAILGFIAIYVTRVAEHDGGSLLGLDGAVRYMLTLYPLGVALAVLTLSNVRASDAPPLARLAFSAMVIALMVVSVYYQSLGILELQRKREVLVQWKEQIQPEPTVTDVWWLPAVLAPYWVEHPIFFVGRTTAAETVLRLEDWSQQATAHGVRDFGYATTMSIESLLAVGSPVFEVGPQRLDLGLNTARFRIVGSPH